MIRYIHNGCYVNIAATITYYHCKPYCHKLREFRPPRRTTSSFHCCRFQCRLWCISPECRLSYLTFHW